MRNLLTSRLLLPAGFLWHVWPLAMLLLVLVGPASAQEIECTRADPRPVLDSVRVADHHFVPDPDSPSEQVVSAVRAYEVARLPGGRRLEIYHVGCAHYGLLWRFGLGSDHDPSAPAQPSEVTKAAELMSQVATVSRNEGRTEKAIAKQLRTLKDEDVEAGPPYELSEMMGYYVDVWVERADSGATLIVMLDVAL